MCTYVYVCVYISHVLNSFYIFLLSNCSSWNYQCYVSSESQHSYLVLNLSGKALFFTFENISCGFVISSFYYTKICSSYPQFFGGFLPQGDRCWT